MISKKKEENILKHIEGDQTLHKYVTNDVHPRHSAVVTHRGQHRCISITIYLHFTFTHLIERNKTL